MFQIGGVTEGFILFSLWQANWREADVRLVYSEVRPDTVSETSLQVLGLSHKKIKCRNKDFVCCYLFNFGFDFCCGFFNWSNFCSFQQGILSKLVEFFRSWFPFPQYKKNDDILHRLVSDHFFYFSISFPNPQVFLFSVSHPLKNIFGLCYLFWL